MGKSIRSKIKRKHRSEFRATIGDDAYQANMKETQAKLKECLDRQTLKSLSKLSSQLGTDDDTNNNNDKMDINIELIEDNNNNNNDSIINSINDDNDKQQDSTTTVKRTIQQNVGENKAVVRRKIAKNFRQKSYRDKILERNSIDGTTEQQTKKRPKYFCQF